MLPSDINVTDSLCEVNEEFRSLYEQHIHFEQDLEALYSLKYFPPEVELRIKEIKKAKLKNKDRMQQLINEYESSLEK